uniref:hypothetical protein n=1 Tax=Candidatus Scatomorpha intestinigallinarum TaxID=2840923 RepID=UPI004027D357
MSRKLERRLRAELGSIPSPAPRAEHLAETAALSLAAWRSRRPLRRIGVPEMVLGQLRFIAAPIWALQAVIVLCICLLLHLASAAEDFEAEGPALLGMASVFVAMSVLPFHGRSRRFNMRETEGATRASHGKLMLAKLCALALGDAVCLAALSRVSAGLFAGAAGLTLACIVLPFLLCCTGVLLILDRAGGEQGMLVALGFGLALAAGCRLLPEELGAVLAGRGRGFAAAACALLAAVLALECRRLLRQAARPDAYEAVEFQEV